MNNYISYLQFHDIDVLLIQEPGPYINFTETQSNTFNSKIYYYLNQINYISYTNWNQDERYSLITLTKKHLSPIIKKIPSLDPHIQHLTIPTNIGTLNIINTYINHNKLIRDSTILNLNQLTTDKTKYYLIGGDLNSFPNSKLDYFSNTTTKYNKNEKQKTFESICQNNLIDTYRVKNPQKKSFTKWTLTSTTTPTRITATRLDHFLIFNKLTQKVHSSKIIYDDVIQSDHYPILLTLFINTPQKKQLHNSQSTQKNPHWSLWPLELANHIESSLKNLSHYHINKPSDIEYVTEHITSTIQTNFKNYTDTLTITTQNTKTNLIHIKIKKLRHSLINLKSTIKKHIIKQTPLPNKHSLTVLNSKFIQLTKTTNPNLPSLYNHPTELFTQTIIAIKSTTKLLHKINKKENHQNLKYKINKILTHKELSTKIIYCLIKNSSKSEHVNYIINEENNDIKVEVNPDKISNFIYNKYKDSFASSTDSKPLSFWLNHTPILETQDTSLPDTSTEKIEIILTNRSNTAPGIDKIQFDIFKFLAHHKSSYSTFNNHHTKLRIYICH